MFSLLSSSSHSSLTLLSLFSHSSLTLHPLFTRAPSTTLVHMGESHLQGFRLGPSPVVHVQARRDPKTGEYIVLWRDIQHAFPGLDHVRDGSIVVSFATDDNFEFLEPKRIEYLAGAVLDVVLRNTELNPPDYLSTNYTSVNQQSPGQGADGGHESNKVGFSWGTVCVGAGAVIGGVLAGPVIISSVDSVLTVL
ncbi:hypothetical protein B0O80DRAFT_287627 [Mortierella sp. GBAus27b]|nr:hypothetical protein B0O80DRAFT_287627 [Mortierella sp. GBAus27b]